MNKLKILQELLLLLIFVVLNSGCERDPVNDSLNSMKENAPIDMKKQIEIAQEMWQNGKVDREPILISADLTKAEGTEDIYIGLITFDEDTDVIGIGIKEEYINPNNLKTTLTEEYPAFVYRMSPDVDELRLCPVQIRNDSQRKSNQQWEEYIKGEGIDVSTLKNTIRWRQTLPPVWVSIPDPNHTHVQVYIYDKAGNKSKPIKLEDYLTNRI